MKLILCAGATKRSGWLTLDSNPSCGPDFVETIPPLPPRVTVTRWNQIELVHGITSFYPWEAEELLRQIREVLAPGGKLVLEQPNFLKCDRVEWLFGDPGPKDRLHMNRWAYTPNSLEALVRRVGFEHCRQTSAEYHNIGRDFRIEAW